jgi:hypothetical protein
MKQPRSKTNIVLIVGLMFMAASWGGCKPKAAPTDATNDRNTVRLKEGKIEPKEAKGGRYPEERLDPKRPLNEETPPKIPSGPKRGDIKPTNNPYKIRELKPGPEGSGDSQAPLFFGTLTDLDGSTPIAHSILPEPSVAANGQTIMTTGNDWMSLSEDGGATFTTVHPSTIFPQDYGGYCCDQVLNYVPQYDLFVWLLQYRASGATNAIRIAVQNTQGVRDSNGTSWTYWDFTNNIFAPAGRLDYNDMSFGNTFLYWTSSVGGGANRYVIRVPLQELAARSTVHFQFTGSTNAYWSHVTQNGSNGVYWAGHVNNSTLLVYSMMDADGFYSWRNVDINSWPNDANSSTAADGNDWLMDASWKTYVRAAAIRGNNVFFAWNASRGGGYPQGHVQIAEISTSTFTLANQMSIWNPDFAFAYPYFEVSGRELGMIVAFGGGPFNSSSGVGVWGDFVVYYPRLSAQSRTNYGHYHTARRSGLEGAQWVSAGYTYQADGTVLPYFLSFHR